VISLWLIWAEFLHGRLVMTRRIISNRGIFRSLAVAVAAGFCGQAAIAASVTYDIELDAANYGDINQTDVGPNSNVAGHTTENNFCAPTATMNSFEFLQNEYPDTYGTNDALQGGTGSWLDAAKLLAGPDYMSTDPDTGTDENNWVGGKVGYLDKFAPGKTVFEGQDPLYTGTQAGIDKTTKPTAMFLKNMLQAGEDIEIGITPASGDTGHVMTVSSIDWTDADSNGSFNTGDSLSIDGIDPAGGTTFNYTLTPAGNAGFAAGFMTFNGGPYGGYRLDAILAESPVPLPTAALPGFLLLTGLGVYRKMRPAALV
jgi:hypothetical protein